MTIANKTRLRYFISSPWVNRYKRKLLQSNRDVKVFWQLTTTTTSTEALTLRSKNQITINKTPWLKAAFWARLAELYYLESEVA